MMALEDRVRAIRDETLRQHGTAVPDTFQGVTKERIRRVLRRLDLDAPDMVDAVFALLDDQAPSWYSGAREGLRFCEGASTAHIGCHVGILQRGGNKLDREGRDYWIKPLRDLGAIEPVYLMPESGDFIPGHPIPKSSNSAYRLNDEFRAVLQAPEHSWADDLDLWVSEEVRRVRLTPIPQITDVLLIFFGGW